jgi:hypothetical protein
MVSRNPKQADRRSYQTTFDIDLLVIPLGLQTLAFPESSALLVHTKQIHNPAQSSKRLFDTSVLMTEIVSFTPSSDRFRQAVSRINYLHSRYGDRITNEQLVYVLGVFACNPQIWAERWEWRRMNELEMAALGTFWMGVGRMMRIDMREIKGCGKDDPRYLGKVTLSPTTSEPENKIDIHNQDQEQDDPKDDDTNNPPTWVDGLDWMIDMRAYMDLHEAEYLGRSEDTDALVEETFRMMLDPLPKWIRGWVREVAAVGFEERFRRASG